MGLFLIKTEGIKSESLRDKLQSVVRYASYVLWVFTGKDTDEKSAANDKQLHWTFSFLSSRG